MNYRIFILFIYITMFVQLHPQDIVRFEKGEGLLDVKMAHKLEIINMAMEKTIKNYGSYKITFDAPRVNSSRAREYLKTGELLNTFIAVSSTEWEQTALAIKIPLRLGLLNYKIFLVNNDSLNLFSNIRTLEDLKKIKIGAKNDWIMADILEYNGLNVIRGSDYDGLFPMLNFNRFDGIPRGINEIYREYDNNIEKFSNLSIEQHLLLEIYSPTYLFVSPMYPELAKRLREGLEIMVEDGSLKDLFYKYFQEDITRSKVEGRHLIKLENPYAPRDSTYYIKEYWFDPFKGVMKNEK